VDLNATAAKTQQHANNTMSLINTMYSNFGFEVNIIVDSTLTRIKHKPPSRINVDCTSIHK
jgi:hypothetical protein